jgi:hypothetical protein
MIKKLLFSAILATSLMSAPANAQSIEIGVLTCDIDGGFGAIFGSNRQASCAFVDKSGNVTPYTAEITKVGVDLGFVAAKTLTWAVLAASNNVPRNLRGTYVGANVEASALIGVGGNAMVGGMRDSFALNPISIQTQTGVNAALAVQVLRIR